MAWKQIKIFVSDSKQSAIIEPTPELHGMVMHSMEETEKQSSFTLYMTFEEARVVGKELIKYADEMELTNKNK